MTDYLAFIPVVNRPDLLQNVLRIAKTALEEIKLIDNSKDGWVSREYPTMAMKPPVPLTFTQTMNWEFSETLKRSKKFCVHMHNDAVIPPGAIQELLAYARRVDAYDKRWGVLWTLYDVLCVYNPIAADDIGGFDTNFSAYYSDNDFYHRLRKRNWETINTGIKVGHVGSQTINSDPELGRAVSFSMDFYKSMFVAKWGGEPDHEKFDRPYDR